MKAKTKLRLTHLLFMIVLSQQIIAQENLVQLTPLEQQTVIDSITSKLNANYVFPDVAIRMTSRIKAKFENGDYKSIQHPRQFASILTTDLQAISKDKHLRISFDPEQVKEEHQVVTEEDSLAFLNTYINNLKRSNFGFKELKILDGNIGYIDLRSFSNVKYAGERAVAAMNFVSDTDAIIIDLRLNGGGSENMIQLIASYLLSNKRVHLNSFYWRPSDSYSQTWTLQHISGNRSPDTPVYILTSSNTFSAAEGFSYILKNLNRATIVGETTRGGAHPVNEFIATDKFLIRIPTGRAINPITNSNWEGVGVVPHIKVPAHDALDTAHIKALEMLIKKNKDENLAALYQWSIEQLKVKNNPITLNPEKLKSFVGSYGPRVITFENGKLYYQRDGGTKFELYPYSNSEFMLKGSDSFRIRFLLEDNNVIALQGLYYNGRIRIDENVKESE